MRGARKTNCEYIPEPCTEQNQNHSVTDMSQKLWHGNARISKTALESRKGVLHGSVAAPDYSIRYHAGTKQAETKCINQHRSAALFAEAGSVSCL
ncbi:hypothetical protein DXA97_12485 [Clostridium sp. OF09-36]|nr:hypothetical protein DXA97_12485 [Clostridium sp. OF09-36]